MEELPIRVDLMNGLDGAEISEIIFALRMVGGALMTTGQSARGRLMHSLADRIERLHIARRTELTQFLEQKYGCEKLELFVSGQDRRDNNESS